MDAARQNGASEVSLGSFFVNSRRLITLGENPSLTTITAQGAELDHKTMKRLDGSTDRLPGAAGGPADTLALGDRKEKF
ncbi:MAG: hypothetical protein KJ726_03045 [Verrucomicrobia bacterium]|nr:hypothetical protein [Verrucomicrobiota bacterium]MBU1909002.1 hypothetical protein [Verrucomicrobiota bacterium]